MKLHRSWPRPSRRTAVIGFAVLGCLAYVFVPKLVWLQRQLSLIDAATEAASVELGKPALDWKTVDLAGTPHSLIDYRGQVVVLDFWFSGCGWCLRSMPELNELADEFEDEQVTFLGVNSDSNLDAALRVANNFNLEHTILSDNLDDMTIHEQYHITMWPTVLVLDQQGVLRHVHCGYWPTMRSSLSERIQELLAHK